MYFLEKSFLQTSTQIQVDVNTALAENIMSRDETRQYFTSNYNNDLLTASLTINFDVTTTVDCLVLMEMNLKGFNVFYNGVTANAFALVPTSSTNTSQFVNNDQKDMFLEFTPVACNSITIDMNTTFLANSEKAIGYMVPTAKILEFTRNPSYRDYKPLRKNEEVVHRLSNGGTRINIKDKKFMADIKLKYVPLEMKDELEEVHRATDEFIYVAFPQTVNWDGVCFPCVWEGSFDFENFSNNSPAAGYEGIIKLRETP